MNPESLIKCSGNRCLSSEASIQMLGYLILKIISSLQISSYRKGLLPLSLLQVKMQTDVYQTPHLKEEENRQGPQGSKAG